MVYSSWFAENDGDFYRAINATPGTGIAQNITAGFSATDGILSIRNGDVNVLPGAQRRILPVYLRLIPTVVPASATRSEGLIAIDGITRYSSGGSAITTLVNSKMNQASASVAVVHFGALTFVAESANVRRVERFQLRSAIPVQFEEFVIVFGGSMLAGRDTAPGTLGGSTALRAPVTVGAVELHPGQTMTVHLWHPGNAATAASWEFSLAYREKVVGLS